MTQKMGDRQRANRRFMGLVNAEEAGHILGRTRRTICSWEKTDDVCLFAGARFGFGEDVFPS